MNPINELFSTPCEDVRAEIGQTMAEYSVVLGVIVIGVVVTLGLLNAAIKGMLTNVISLI